MSVVLITEADLKRLEEAHSHGDFLIEVQELIGKKRSDELLALGYTTREKIMKAIREEILIEERLSGRGRFDSFVSGQDLASQSNL